MILAEFSAGEWVIVTTAVIGSIASAIVSVINAFKINAVHKVANSLSDKRNEATQKAAHAEGVLAEKADQQFRLDIRAGVTPQEVTVVNPPSQPVPVSTPGTEPTK